MSFTAEIPISQLHPHQALALINRWIKLKGYWFHEDRDALYKLKDDCILEWVKEGTMIPTKVIERETEAIKGMNHQLATGGADLEPLDRWGNGWNEFLEASQYYCYYDTLSNFAGGEIIIPLPQEEQDRLLGEYNQAEEEYKRSHDLYCKNLKELNSRLSQPKLYRKLALELETFSVSLQKSKQNQLVQPIQWLKTGSLTINQAQPLLKLLKRIKFPIDSLIENTLTVHPVKELQEPQKPVLARTIDSEGYVPGSISHVEEALSWAKERLGNSSLRCADFSEDFIFGVIEPIVAEDALEILKSKALDIFQDALKKKNLSPKEVYESLTGLRLDYEDAIGMRSYTNRWHDTKHADYSKWHEINLSFTGGWLVEFESKADASICLHIPYDLAKNRIPVESLPREFSEQETYGRGITPSEQKAYPVAELLAILGKNPSDFPCELKRYSRWDCEDFSLDSDDELDD